MIVNSPVAIGILAIVGLWVAFLVPNTLRRRQYMKDSRAEDRFSGELRVLAVCTDESSGKAASQRSEPSSSSAILTPPLGMESRPQLTARQGGTMSGSTMSPARRALLDERAAAARRRAILTLGLITATIILLVVGLSTAMSAAWALIPATLTGTVMVLGRRAVVAQERADAARAERAARRNYPQREMTPTERRLAGRPVPAVRTGEQRTISEDISTTVISRVEASMFAKKHVTGRPVAKDLQHSTARPSAPVRARASVSKLSAASTISALSPATAATPAVPSAAAKATTASPAMTASAQSPERAWTSTPVPPPVYAAKAAAPRWEPAGITTELQQITKARMEQIARESAARGEQDVSDDAAPAVSEQTPDSLGVSLNSVLARRRAV
ncbi:hypothetical protein [Timonella senegalensis]|uniref:hypothetical protein n=1 Tax=Timonella senegalensis TaxID=1465825 RepID=UPI0028A69F20|nr:hypothetical protein [Timonella senegalensis]